MNTYKPSTCVISIVRLSTLDAAATSSDSTWDNTEAALWSYLELTIALMAACLPTLRPFMARFFPKFINTVGPVVQNRPEVPTWGGTGGDPKTPVGQYSKVSDSTDALYADPEIGMETLPPPPPAEDPPQRGVGSIRVYKEAVAARRGRNETVIGAGPGSRSSEQSEGEPRPYPGIRATTVIRQEYQNRR